MPFARLRLASIFLLLVSAFNFAISQERLDLNTATKEQLATLPISKQQVEAIYKHRIIYGRFKSIFDVQKVKGLDAPTYKKIKSLIVLMPDQNRDFRMAQREKMYRELEDYASEGTNDNEADHFIDLALNPNNVNKMSYQQLLNLPRVSPIDAQRIRFHLDNIGEITSDFSFKNVDNLDYYGYRNARNFLSFKDGIGNDNKLHGFYTFRTYDTEYLGEEGANIATAGARTVQEEQAFNVYHKARFTYNNIKAGISHSENLGEPSNNDYKAYFQMSDLDLGSGLKVEDIILGNYNITFGQGVVMENTDFFTPRKNGLGFKKRYQGIIGDISRSRNHDLFGFATKINYRNKLEFTPFFSSSKRDAILNDDGSVNMFINLSQRLKGDYVYHTSLSGTGGRAEHRPLAIDSVPNMVKTVEELTFGAELKYNFSAGTYLGFTYVESWYDRFLRPNAATLFTDDQQDDFVGRFRHNELTEGIYGGSKSDIDGGTDYKAFRRVYGLHGQMVLGDWALSAEYGILDTSVERTLALANADSVLETGDTYTPTALVLSSYLQKPNFSLLVAFRDYDLGYDNPYQHSMSNYQRFKGTMIDDGYRLNSPYYTQLHLNADQPQAERGFHINARYRFSGQLTFITEDDIWKRVSDGVEQYRLVGRLQYRPIYPLRFELRQKWQARDEDNIHSEDFFSNNETRMTLSAYLSGNDRLELTLGRSSTRFSQRPDLRFSPDPSTNGYYEPNSSILSEGNVIGVSYRHNFTNNFKISGQFLSYQGFYWNFEDTQFMVLNSINGAYRFWLSVVGRISDNISMRVKYTHDDKQNDNNRYTRNVSSTTEPFYYNNTQEIGSSNFMYFELVMSF